MMTIEVRQESWPVRGVFTIARGSRTAAEVVVVEITENGLSGRGECVPYRRYGETIDSVMAEIRSGKPVSDMPPGAARNALDSALLDLECKKTGRRSWEILGLPAPAPKPTCFTISIDRPECMARAAADAAAWPILKVKLAGTGDDHGRVAAVRAARPEAILIVDANESWSSTSLAALAPRMAELDVALIEQPLPSGADEALLEFRSPVPLCADESTQDAACLSALKGRYDYVNIKLDKTGGVRNALSAAREAREAGLKIMLGCMLATSLSMAPATLLMDLADFVDLDGPLLLARDRAPPLRYSEGRVQLPDPELWG